MLVEKTQAAKARPLSRTTEIRPSNENFSWKRHPSSLTPPEATPTRHAVPPSDSHQAIALTQPNQFSDGPGITDRTQTPPQMKKKDLNPQTIKIMVLY
jgi:hypothetical protein